MLRRAGQTEILLPKLETPETKPTKKPWKLRHKPKIFHGKKVEVAPTEKKHKKDKHHIPFEKLSLQDNPRVKVLNPDERFDLQVSDLEYIRFLQLDGDRLKRAIAAMPLKTVQEIIKTYHEYKAAESSLMTNLTQEPQTTLTDDVPSTGFASQYECKPCTSQYGW